jgi:hypothetical protein
MDSTSDANRSWNKQGEALVQAELGVPTGQTSKGYNYWGINPESTTQPSTEALDFKTMPEFTIDRKREILTNLAAKHGVTQQEAYEYINEALNDKTKNPVTIINKLKECY